MEYKWRKRLHRCMCKTHLTDIPREVGGERNSLMRSPLRRGHLKTERTICQTQGPSYFTATWSSVFQQSPWIAVQAAVAGSKAYGSFMRNRGIKQIQQREKPISIAAPMLFTLLLHLFDILLPFSVFSLLQIFLLTMRNSLHRMVMPYVATLVCKIYCEIKQADWELLFS